MKTLNKEPSILPVFIAIILVLLLCFGFYWGICIVPKQEKYWSDIQSVSAVTRATIKIEDDMITIQQSDAEKLFRIIQNAPEYSPNHPVSTREGVISFSTNKGAFSFQFTNTAKQGVIIYFRSSLNQGWNFGIKRCDELSPFLDKIKKHEHYQK